MIKVEHTRTHKVIIPHYENALPPKEKHLLVTDMAFLVFILKVDQKL